jgi:hypothetical protein
MAGSIPQYPPSITIEGVLHVRVEATATLLHPGGSPWTTAVRVDITGRQGSLASEMAAPDATGLFSAYVYLPEAEAVSSACEAEIWGDPVTVSQRGSHGPFLSAAEGEAGFSAGVSLGDASSGATLNLGNVTITQPPLVAGITLSPAAPLALTLSVTPGSSEQLGIASGPWFDWTQDVSIGHSQIDLYAWGSEGWFNFELFNAEGSIVYCGEVRRNQFVTAPYADDVRFDVAVNLTTFPTAKRVLFVPPALHQLNPAAPEGSDVSFEELFDSTAHGPLDGAGVLNHVYASAEEVYVQLWGRDANNGYHLLDWEHVPFSTGTVNLSFP